MRSSHCFLFTCITLFTVSVFGSAGVLAQAPEAQIARNTGAADTAAATDDSDDGTTASAKTVDPATYRTTPGINTRRIGVNMTQTRSLSLTNAITLALQNNNDIEVTRSDVKIAEATLRSLLGFYDPMLTVEPTYRKQRLHGQQQRIQTFESRRRQLQLVLQQHQKLDKQQLFAIESDLFHEFWRHVHAASVEEPFDRFHTPAGPYPEKGDRAVRRGFPKKDYRDNLSGSESLLGPCVRAP